MDVEQVFKALADHHRRHLLDILAQTDGQSLNELCAHLPMTRIGVMKHLHILEEAELITTRKVGRERLHYLNSAPIRSVIEWAEQYRRHWDERMDRLDAVLLELQQQAQSNTPDILGPDLPAPDIAATEESNPESSTESEKHTKAYTDRSSETQTPV